MARRQAADYEEKRGVIVDEAARLFADKGFSGASLADLAAACDMSKSLFYHYYPSKEAILYAVMNSHMDDLLTALGEPENAAPEIALRDFARRLLRLYAGAAAKQKVLLYELANLPKLERQEIVSKERRLIAHVETLLSDAGATAGSARAGAQSPQLRARAMLFFGMLNWTHSWLRPGAPVTRDEVADMAAAMALSPP